MRNKQKQVYARGLGERRVKTIFSSQNWLREGENDITAPELDFSYLCWRKE